jgi:hypothetical protein
MLTSVPEALVKDTKTNHFCIENGVMYILKRLIIQVLRIVYHI